MQLRKLVFAAAFLLCAVAVVQAQSSLATLSDEKLTVDSEEDFPELEGENWTFYHDKDRKVYYIDFETISVNLNELRIKDEKGNIIFKDDLWNLPVDTIYELDFSKFEPGRYQIELRTFTGFIKKDVLIESE